MFGQNEDEDEEFNKMITQLAGAPRSGPMGSPEDFFAEQPQAAATTPTRQSIYTPPPQVEPQFQQKVGGREFGIGDIAMLGGIVASLLAKKPDVTAALAGQYGGAVMQDQGRRDAQNQEIERYNNKLVNENDPMERWQRDTAAKIQIGNLEARDAATALEREREERMAQRLADEADPESPINQAKLVHAQKLSDIEIAQRKATGEMSLQERLAVIAAEQKGRAARGGYRGGGGGGVPAKPGEETPAQKLKRLKIEKELAILEGGQPTAAQAARDAKRDALLEPLAGYEVADENLWRGTAASPNIKDKLANSFIQLGIAKDALKRMADIRAEVGGESAKWGDADLVAEYNTAAAAMTSAFGQIKNIGVISPSEMSVINTENLPKLDKRTRDMASFMVGDDVHGQLTGTLRELERQIDARAAKIGLRKLGTGPKTGKPAAAAAPAPAAAPAVATTPLGDEEMDSGDGVGVYTFINPKTGVKQQATMTAEEAVALKAVRVR